MVEPHNYFRSQLSFEKYTLQAFKIREKSHVNKSKQTKKKIQNLLALRKKHYLNKKSFNLKNLHTILKAITHKQHLFE